ncbi:MAG: hypothetical protein WCB04_07415 [Mycobacteriales bacterium]
MPSEPSSLLNLPPGGRNPCVACGSERVTELTMTVADGSLLSLAACHRCEVRTWKHGETVLELSEVLLRARKQA